MAEATTPDDDDIPEFLEPLPPRHRTPKILKELDPRLRQIVRQSTTLNRFVRNAWFTDLKIELATGATGHPEILDGYADAIRAVDHLIHCARYAAKKLRQGQQRAQEKLQQESENARSRLSPSREHRKGSVSDN